MKGSMLGLLKKARTIRTSLGLPASGRDEFAFEPDSGISREDQRDILQQIEAVATGNRIAVSPEVFAVKAAKRGILFPILVNLVAIIILVGGLAVLYFFFQRGETQLAQGETGTITAEGKLIETFKKESEAKLLEKNQQINQIQDRLQEIDKQRQDLQATMDAKVREKESQLKASLSAELEAEKARLKTQGLSEQDINRRLAAIEAQRNAESDKQLAAFRAQAESDRQKADANLKNLQADFNSNLAKANQERQQVLDESKKREADLQAQLEQKTKEAASAQASSQQALAALQSEKQQEDLAAGQLVGLYSVVKADISAKDFPKAIGGLQAIRDYVNRTDVAVLPSMQQRRDVDLFVVDSLTSYVQGQLSPANQDTSSLVAAAGQISEVRAAVSQADAQAKAGNIAEAEKLYDQALSVIPEIQRSYGYFAAKARDAESARQQVLRSGLLRAEAAFDAGNYSEMLAAYKDALGYLPESSVRLDKTLSNIQTAGSEQGKTRSQADQAKAAAPILGQGDAALAQGRPADAMSRYLTVLQRYPQSPQADSAVKGITNASLALSDRADARLSAREKDLNAQVASLQKQVADRGGEITGIKKSIMGLLGMQGDPSATDTAVLMGSLNKKFGDIATAQGASSDLAGRLSRAEDNAAALQKKIDTLDADNQKLKAAADKAAADAMAKQTAAPGLPPASAKSLSQLDGLVAAYNSYSSQEDAIIKSQGEQKGRLRTIGLRDTFLGSMEVVFKGMLDRIHRYDDRFISDSMTQCRSEGRQAAMEQAIDVVIDLAKQGAPEQRKAILEQRLKAADKDPLLKSFLKNLQGLPQMQ
jgi:tetratricopeptide (TPR) repeat protein